MNLPSPKSGGQIAACRGLGYNRLGLSGKRSCQTGIAADDWGEPRTAATFLADPADDPRPTRSEIFALSRTAQPRIRSITDAADTGLAQTLYAIVETTKPGITRMVTITSAVGFVMAAVGRSWMLGELLLAAAGCLLGTALSASGANTLNQWMERRRDGLMKRTAGRPLPSGRLSARTALIAGIVLCVVGVAGLAMTTGFVPAAVSLATILLYLLVYTPLKPVTPLATLVGSVPGALPPLIGWTAASAAGGVGSLGEAGGWALFLIMFVWQVPHFLAIAWMYRDDYAQGGHKVLPAMDPTGTRTAQTIMLWTVCLIPVVLAPAFMMPHLLGPLYLTVAAVTTLWFLLRAAKLSVSRTRDDARATFIASVIHLPLLFMAMVADAMIGVVI